MSKSPYLRADAGMSELADETDSKSVGSNLVWVQVQRDNSEILKERGFAASTPGVNTLLTHPSYRTPLKRDQFKIILETPKEIVDLEKVLLEYGKLHGMNTPVAVAELSKILEDMWDDLIPTHR